MIYNELLICLYGSYEINQYGKAWTKSLIFSKYLHIIKIACLIRVPKKASNAEGVSMSWCCHVWSEFQIFENLLDYTKPVSFARLSRIRSLLHNA